jgi:heat shock protein HslJ
MKKTLGRFLSILAVVGIFGGCAGAASGLGSSLPGTTWVIERIVYADGNVDRGSGESITFGMDGTISVSSCNVCNAEYRISRESLRIAQPMACTRGACQPGRPEVETFLTDARKMHMEGEYLVIEPAEGSAPGPQLLLLPE